MNKFLIILLSITCAVAAPKRGDGVGNGGGIAENNIVFAYHNLSDFIKYALTKEEAFEVQELEILELILKNMPNEYKNKRQLSFLSGRKHPNIFIYPFNEVRIAVTGSKVGTPIYMNTDLLYKRVGNKFEALTITQAVSILVHEMGHHHNFHDELALNSMGAKVAKFSAMKVEKRYLRDFSNLYMDYINMGENSFFKLQVNDGLNSIDLSHTIRQKLRCPEHYGTVVVGAEVWQGMWTKRNWPSWYLQLELITYCSDGSHIRAYGGNELLIYPTFNFQNEKIRIENANTRIRQCGERAVSCKAKQFAVESIYNNKFK